ncbi:MAG: acyl-ACP--UDP-N-acetylglucosamine O-acyltransferase [Gammaproteobacteria bacterium]|nr:acyl-ACP--UDP-N-acetylglucosamine O-acyltransferase [Gammaproteobacteria bacterium]
MIHPTAIIDKSASIDNSATIGPYSIIGADVQIAAGTTIGPHVVINGPAIIGKNNRIFQFASIGEMPQDKKYAGESTRLVIGDNNVIREYCTISRGTVQDQGITRVGSDNWIMAYVHIAHDCQIGSHTIFANSATLAGHVIIEDYAILGGFTLVHQFCKIGAHCFTGMNSVISQDVPPYLMIAGHMARPYGINSEGLKRRGFSSETLSALKKAYKIIYRSGNSLEQAIAELMELGKQHRDVAYLADFLKGSTRGILR